MAIDTSRKHALIGIVRSLKTGITPEELKPRLDRELGDLNATEMVELEDLLLDEGFLPEEIKRVRLALFEGAIYRAPECVMDMPTGTIALNELVPILSNLPVDLTFVDKDDRVKYFSDNRDRAFHRPKSVIGKSVRNCHPAKSLHAVEKILNSFKDGSRDSYEFWINMHDKTVYIRYFAVRDTGGNYLGTVEVTQDITQIQKLKGEKRLLDEE